jgi:hypothetical protein
MSETYRIDAGPALAAYPSTIAEYTGASLCEDDRGIITLAALCISRTESILRHNDEEWNTVKVNRMGP